MEKDTKLCQSDYDTNVLLRRIVAVIADTGILTLILAGTAAPFLIPTWVLIVFAALGQLLYFWILEGLFDLTPGKLATGIRVCKEDGSPIDFRDSLVRNLGRFIDSALSYLVGFAFIIRSDRNQRLGDRYANTIVIKR